MTEALRTEVRHWGIKVVLVEPGDSPTGQPERRIRILRTAAYAERYHNAVAAYERDEQVPFATSLATFMLGQFDSNSPFQKALDAYASRR